MIDKSTFGAFYKSPSRNDNQPGICIISHNVFWFQGASFATDTPPAPRHEIVTQLCSLYRKINADVICLQEIQDIAAAQMVASELEMKYIFQSGGGYPQYGGAVFSRLSMEEIALPQDFMPDRILIPVKVFPETTQPFHIVNIHLPSGRQRGAESQQRRLQELSLVVEQADILVGDFNETHDGQCASLLKEKRFVDAAQACSAQELPSNSYHFRGDQIWLTNDKTDTLQGYFTIPKERLAFLGDTFLSDHFPVGCVLS